MKYKIIFALFMTGSMFPYWQANAVVMVQRPQSLVDITYVPSTGNSFLVSTTTELESAITLAHPGDLIVLKAGAIFSGNFILPEKSGTGWVTIRGENEISENSKQRLEPARLLSALPKIVTPNTDAAVKTNGAAAYYRISGVEITVDPEQHINYGLVQLGQGSESSVELLPHHIILDHLYIHGNDRGDIKRGVSANGNNIAIRNSYISNIHSRSQDAQAIAGWNGFGPFFIDNNYVEASGENIMFGGADPHIRNLVPADIVITNNTITKPLTWFPKHSSYVGIDWSVKNLLELKNATRVLIDHNQFENNWADSQSGFAILFTVRNQDGAAPWSVVKDVTFTNNRIAHVASGINILGYDDNEPSQQTEQIEIANNIFTDVTDQPWGGNGRLFQLLDGPANVYIHDNIGLQAGNILTLAGRPSSSVEFTNNVVNQNQYGIIGDNEGQGLQTIDVYLPGAKIQNNLIIGGQSSWYPVGNYFPTSIAEVGFNNPQAGDFQLSENSAYASILTSPKQSVVPPQSQQSQAQAVFQQLRSGWLVKTNSHPGVFLIIANRRYPFTSMADLADHSYQISQLHTVAEGDLLPYAIVSSFTRPDGTIAKLANNPTVYMLEGTQRKPFTSLSALEKSGYGLQDVTTIPESELTAYGLGDLQY